MNPGYPVALCRGGHGPWRASLSLAPALLGSSSVGPFFFFSFIFSLSKNLKQFFSPSPRRPREGGVLVTQSLPREPEPRFRIWAQLHLLWTLVYCNRPPDLALIGLAPK